jgi:hypothetical protein
MSKALIIYQSKKGKTKRFAESITSFLQAMGLEANVVSVFDCNSLDLHNVTHLFLGCWTRGRFLMGQRPQKEWIQVTERIDSSQFRHIVLFTTYNIATGVMHKSMCQHIHPRISYNPLFFRSRTGQLFDKHKALLYQLFSPSNDY